MTNEAKHTVAWCAGFFDGEGWICLHRRKCYDRPSPRVTIMAGITNTQRDLLQVFVDTWGGRLRPRKGTALSRLPLFEWRLEDKKCEAFLRDIRPLLRGKHRANAEKAIRYREEKKQCQSL